MDSGTVQPYVLIVMTVVLPWLQVLGRSGLNAGGVMTVKPIFPVSNDGNGTASKWWIWKRDVSALVPAHSGLEHIARVGQMLSVRWPAWNWGAGSLLGTPW